MNSINKHIKKVLFFIIIFILIVLIGLTSVGKVESTNGGIFGNIVTGLQKVTYNLGQTLTNSFYSVKK